MSALEDALAILRATPAETAPQSSSEQPTNAGDQALSVLSMSPEQLRALQPPTPFSGLERYGTGLMDPVYGSLQLANRLRGDQQMPMPPGLAAHLPQRAAPDPLLDPNQIDTIVQQREAEYKARRQAAGQQDDTDWWRIGGNVTSPMNFVPVGPPGTSTAARIGMGAVQGAASSLEQPVTDPNSDYWTTKAEQGGSGAVLGGALAPIASAVAGRVSPYVEMLRNAGTLLTPAQEGGALAKLGEAISGKLPFVKNLASGQQANSINEFNRGTYNHVLFEINEKLPPGVTAGHDAFSAAKGKVSDFYQDLMPHLSYDPNYNNGAVVNDILAIKNRLPASQQAEFDRVTQRIFDPHAGDSLKAFDSDLAAFSATRKKAIGNPEVQDLGFAVDDARDLIRSQLAATNPAAAQKLDAADRAFAALKVAEKAGSMTPTAEGVFTPGQILAAGKQGPYGATNSQFMKGNALLQPFAEAGQRVIGSNRSVGNRPATAADMVITELLGSTLGTGLGLGAAGVGAAGQSGYLPEWASYASAAALPALMFTRPGMGLLRAFGPEGVARRAFAGLLGTSAPAATGGLLGR